MILVLCNRRECHADSKLRGCDVVAIWVEDVAASGNTADRATVSAREI
jgi:hypothetical protein